MCKVLEVMSKFLSVGGSHTNIKVHIFQIVWPLQQHSLHLLGAHWQLLDGSMLVLLLKLCPATGQDTSSDAIFRLRCHLSTDTIFRFRVLNKCHLRLFWWGSANDITAATNDGSAKAGRGKSKNYRIKQFFDIYRSPSIQPRLWNFSIRMPSAHLDP
jgi:hypothetical protein